MNKSPRSRSIPVRTIPSNAIKHREREIERLLAQTHSKETSLGVWRQNGTTKAFRGNLKVYEGIRDHEHSLWRANKQGASSAIALCCRLELPLTVCVYVCMQGPPTPPGATPLYSPPPQPPSTVQPFLIASSTVRALNYGVAQASTQPYHLDMRPARIYAMYISNQAIL